MFSRIMDRFVKYSRRRPKFKSCYPISLNHNPKQTYLLPVEQYVGPETLRLTPVS